MISPVQNKSLNNKQVNVCNRIIDYIDSLAPQSSIKTLHKPVPFDSSVDSQNRQILYTVRDKSIQRKPQGQPVIIKIFDLHVNNNHIGHVGISGSLVSDLKVFPSFRKQGYSSQLMRWLLSRNKAPLRLVARPSNEPDNIPLPKLINFYQSFGFLPIIKHPLVSCHMVKLSDESKLSSLDFSGGTKLW